MSISMESALARESIRDALARYSMLLDGDGARRDPRGWADQMFTPDAVFKLYYPDGTEQYRIEGREAIFNTFGPPGSKKVGTRHFMVNTVFDELTATSAKTRTSALIQVSKRDQECANAKGINGGQ